ncbi:deubiquitinase OTUD6B-like [Patiria miniata]|uniref:ubiquitinyl hydrolase 1 n=1 Tax=Patiria miniata TaxID=46514 RepID=A0A914B3F9_PATMI|nr:deubiquitinase OTUD6B-like [Patiria miniata]
MADDEETLLQKHRKERKELQAQVQALKRSIPKGDKKKKKEVTTEIAKLESDLSQRQEEELSSLKEAEEDDAHTENQVNGSLPEQVGSLSLGEDGDAQPTRISKAQKRRDKKAAQEKEREARAAEDAANLESSSRRIEERKMEALLAERGLRVKEISSDGHCLYNAVQYQLGLRGTKVSMQQLREQVSDYMQSHADDFMCFLSKPDSGDPYTLEDYEKYCRDIATTAAWGGHHEISAMTHLFKLPIQIIQADSPTLTIGEQFQQQPLVLSYHRHAYGLGEHYNSTMPVSSQEQQGEDKGL